MDPAYLDNEIWHSISVMLRFLWGYVLFALGFAALFLTAHAIIPSLANTGHIPSSITKMRPLVYAAAFGSLLIAIALLTMTLINTGWISKVWDSYLI
jgi:hypothetical protein